MKSPAIDWAAVEVLPFDCYGTLIDWESGILASLRSVLGASGSAAPEDGLLESCARHEAPLEAEAWRPYRQILREALVATVTERGVSVPASARAGLGGSVAEWPAFPDSVAALARDRVVQLLRQPVCQCRRAPRSAALPPRARRTKRRDWERSPGRHRRILRPPAKSSPRRRRGQRAFP